MKTLLPKLKKWLLSMLVFFIACIFSYGKLAAQDTEKSDKTISPFFYVECKDSAVEQLPLKSTNVDVSIAE